MNTIDEAIAILQAMKEGKKLQIRKREVIDGCECFSYYDAQTDLPNFAYHTYRVRPAPKEIWVNEYATGFNEHIAIHFTETAARECASGRALRTAVRYREVIE